MTIKVFKSYFLNFDISRLNPSNFTFEMANFLIGPNNITVTWKSKKRKKEKKKVFNIFQILNSLIIFPISVIRDKPKIGNKIFLILPV